MAVPFNRFRLGPLERDYLERAASLSDLDSGGEFSDACIEKLRRLYPTGAPLLTSSGSGSLEIAARLVVSKNSEVIVPSFAFPTCATAFASSGASIRFADIDAETLMLNASTVSSVLTKRTVAILLLNYAGSVPPPNDLVRLADEQGIHLIEDNAHGIGATYFGAPLGTFGKLSTISFHSTKNIACGEGGALLVNDPSLVSRATYLRDKGTNRQEFSQGRVDKYTMQELGSNWVLPELSAAVLAAQLHDFDRYSDARLRLWNRYMQELKDWATNLGVGTPSILEGMRPSGHIFYLLFPDSAMLMRFETHLKAFGISSATHYRPLHASKLGSQLDPGAQCPRTTRAADTLTRLPLYQGMAMEEIRRVIEACLVFRG